VAAVIAAAALIGVGVPALEDDPADPSAPPAATVAASTEEDAAIAEVLAAIEAGEPLPYSEDGQTFQNREGLLPDQPLGYYREYTVATPGSPDRGARRLVIGEGGETYYTDDHYASFTRIDPAEYDR
jgi:ribonuclease T1